MADQSIFTTEVPAGHNFFDNAPITLSTSFYTKVDTVIDAARWWASSNRPVGGTYELVLFESTAEDTPVGNGEGVVIGQVSVPSPAGVPLDTWTDWQPFPVLARVRAYHVYKVGLRTSLGSYTATGNAFNATTTIGDFVTPQSNVFDAAVGGTYYNGSYTPDITNYPDQTFNATAYFIDARIPDLGGVLTRVGQQQVVASGGTTTLSLNITPDAGDIVVVKTQTWDYTIPSGAITDASSRLSFTRQINGNASGFVPYVAIDTAVCSARPTSPITITSTPGSACRHSMEVEIWRNGTLGAAVVATRGSTDLSTSMSATAGSVISWIASDSQSRDPANSVLVSGSSLVYTDDGHVGSNSVTYYGVHPVTSTGTPTFGIASNGSNTFSGKIAGIEILQATGGPTPTPVSQQFDLRWAVYQQATQQYDLRWAVYQQVAQQYDLRWSVSTLVGRQYDLRWAVYQQVAQQYDLRWAVAALVSAQYDLRWSVAQQVIQQFDLRWSVAALVSNQFDLRWSVTGRVKAQFSLKWSVDAFGPALPTKPIVVNRRTDALVINRTTGIDFTVERG